MSMKGDPVKVVLFDQQTLDFITGWPLGLLCWGFVIYVVVMRFRWS